MNGELRTAEIASQIRELLDREIYTPQTYARQTTLIVWSVSAVALVTGIATITSVELPMKLPVSAAYLIPFLGCSVVCILASFLLSVWRDLARISTNYVKAYLLQVSLQNQLLEEHGSALQQMIQITDVQTAASKVFGDQFRSQIKLLSDRLESLRQQADARASRLKYSDGLTIVSLKDQDHEAIEDLEKEIENVQSAFFRSLANSSGRESHALGIKTLEESAARVRAQMEELNRPFLSFLRVRRISIFIECCLPLLLAMAAIGFVLLYGR